MIVEHVVEVRHIHCVRDAIELSVVPDIRTSTILSTGRIQINGSKRDNSLRNPVTVIPYIFDATYFRLASYHAGTEDPPPPPCLCTRLTSDVLPQPEIQIFFMLCGKIEKSLKPLVIRNQPQIS